MTLPGDSALPWGAEPLAQEIGARRKEPLHLRSPLLAAARAAGSGALLRALCLSERLGAIVLPPLGHGAVKESSLVTLEPITAGYLISHSATIGRRRLAWLVRRCRSYSDVPLIASIAPQDAGASEHLCQMALDTGLTSIELHLAPDTTADDAAAMVARVASAPLQACLVRIPLTNSALLAEAAASAGADALVISAPALGRVRSAGGTMVEGEIHSPALLPLYAQAVQAAVPLGIPVIARGGIATWQDVLTMLASGATAVELDSILWVEPASLDAVYDHLRSAVDEAGVSHWAAYLQGLRS